ncbi:transcriptional regulator CynR [Pseudomonas sp. NPDC089741]|uniref:transcriptional regulator CynR n=1 Tax=Pseudomonas sp. NPDC089741 TaxID=3364470 RepID=UPI00381FBD00
MLLRHLRYLLAVADNGGFTRAAEMLHVSQPTLSQQIRQLEGTLGVSLFDRTSRMVKPTEAGLAYIDCARRVLSELSAGRRALQDIKDLSRGILRLAMTPTFMAYLAGSLVNDYAAAFPSIHLEIYELSVSDLETGLMNDSFDIAIAFDQIVNAEIESIPAFVETLGIVVGSAHSLYNSQHTLTVEGITELQFALPTSNFETRAFIDEYFERLQITPKVIIETNSINTLLEVIRHTPVATILPEAIATQIRTVCKVPLINDPLERQAVLMRRKSGYHSTASLAFTNLALAKFNTQRDK